MLKIFYFIFFWIILTNFNLNAQINSGLVAYYPFNGNANDESGNGNNGIIYGATLSSDRFGSSNKAYLYNGIDNFISVNNFPLLNNTFSYSAWIKINGNNYDNYIQSFGILGPEPSHTWNFSYNNISRSWDLWDNSNGSWYTNYNNASGNTLEWTHVVVVYANNLEYLYVNDTLRNSRTVSLPISLGGGHTLLLGKINNVQSQCLNGLIDDVRIYSRELTAAEIHILYNEGSSFLKLTVIPQGYYNSIANKLYKKDTINIYLRQPSSPFTVVESSSALIDSVTFTGTFNFYSAPSGLYYVVAKHKNCIETWSSSPVNFIRDTTTNFNFTTNLSQAFGNNMIQVDNSPVRFGIYSGDVNQSNFIDGSDLLMIDNDASNFLTGNSITDLTGNGFVDASDLAIADNNVSNYIATITP